jgi:hypothetical protein
MVTAPQAVADARDPLHRTVICAKLVTAQPSFAVTFRTRKEWESGECEERRNRSPHSHLSPFRERSNLLATSGRLLREVLRAVLKRERRG